MTTATIDRVPARTRDEVLARLRAHEAEIRGFGATALYLFGSAARDEMTEASDVDVFIDYERDGSFTFVEWVDLHELIERLLRRRTDFTSRQGLNKRSRRDIEQSAIRVL